MTCIDNGRCELLVDFGGRNYVGLTVGSRNYTSN